LDNNIQTSTNRHIARYKFKPTALSVWGPALRDTPNAIIRTILFLIYVKEISFLTSLFLNVCSTGELIGVGMLKTRKI